MPDAARHLTLAELEAGLDAIRRSPRAAGKVDMIVRRPSVNEREVLESANLDPELGLVGDRWSAGNRRGAQLTLMNSRVIELLAQERARWPLAGDQLYVDLDLSVDNVAPGTRLAVGDALIEVIAEPHMPCGKFRARYGVDAFTFVNSQSGTGLQLRGINARIVAGGEVRAGAAVRKVPSP